MRYCLAWVGSLLPAAVIATAASAAPSTTLHQTVTGEFGISSVLRPYQQLKAGPGWPRVVRNDLSANLDDGRKQRRSSLLHIGQLSDFQLADEESPMRTEYLDGIFGYAEGAWRPQEALTPFMNDRAIRAVNRFHVSPVRQGSGERAKMDFVLTTGDSADSKQRNETEWVLKLLDGGALSPNSGIDPKEQCPAAKIPAGEAERYTGVQDAKDYPKDKPADDKFFDPDGPAGRWAPWPTYPGLLDRAQRPFTAAGLKVPSYVTFGNHDGLAQGNFRASEDLEQTALGCKKKFAGSLQVDVPPDPQRQFVDKRQYRDLHADGARDDHGFALVDSAELAASDGAASYYSWSPNPQFKFIALDTVAEGGGSEGNIDEPQFEWLKSEIENAEASSQLVVLFGHHSVSTLTNRTEDEKAGKCNANDEHGHDVNPGCDRDPRPSVPLHLGVDSAKKNSDDDLVGLLLAHDNAIAYISGHTHVHDIVPYKRDGGGGFWEIGTASEVDWPIQSRLIEFMDNQDGTLSIFGTLIDQAGAIEAPPSGTGAETMSESTLATIGRTFSYNDPLGTQPKFGGLAGGEGDPEDRNVELLLPDPLKS